MRCWVLLALFSFSASLQAGDPASAERLYRQGLEAEAQKAYIKAAVLFEGATLADPGHALAFRHLGNSSYYLGEKTKALRAYRQYLRLRPGDKELEAFVRRLEPPTPTATLTPAPAGEDSPPPPGQDPFAAAPSAGLLPEEAGEFAKLPPSKDGPPTAEELSRALFLRPSEGDGWARVRGWRSDGKRSYHLYYVGKLGKKPQQLNEEPFKEASVIVTGLRPGTDCQFRLVRADKGEGWDFTMWLYFKAEEGPRPAPGN